MPLTKRTLNTLNEVIASVPLEEQLEIDAAIAELREKVGQHGNAGQIAIAVLWAELAAEKTASRQPGG